MRTWQLLSCAIALATASGCASIVTGHNQPLSVQTPDCDGASCVLMNSKGTWYVKSPGSVVVHRAYGDLTITCSKEGYPTTTNKVASTTKAMAFGNIVFGGLIGVGVDVGTGAAYDYPDLVSNPMSCKGPANVEAPAPAPAPEATRDKTAKAQ